MPDYDVLQVASRFAVRGDVVSAVPYGNGHINDTFLVVTASGDRYILQRVNHHVFREPGKLMENVRRVTTHVRSKMAAASRDPERNSLTLVETRDGAHWYVDEAGNTWRTYLFIRDSVGYDIVRTPAQAWQGGSAFGEFQRMLTDLPGEPLHETIPRFHDMESRLARFRDALEKDSAGRARLTAGEIGFIERRAVDVTRFMRLEREGRLSRRTTHNDTKFNNVLLDSRTDEAVCVIDLDTVMPGLVLFDFGDSVRTVTNTAAEDEEDRSKVRVDLELFRGFASGYLSQARSFLADVELDELAYSGIVMTFIIGLRFFTDYLEGDHYFKIHKSDHNLIRARAQFALVESMESNLDTMRSIVEQYSRDI